MKPGRILPDLARRRRSQLDTHLDLVRTSTMTHEASSFSEQEH
jgi:hypothetical protein